MKKYFVAYVDDNGDNRDAFVNATTPQEAVKYWKEGNDFVDPEDDERTLDAPEPTHVFELNLQLYPEAGIIPWEDTQAIIRVTE